MVPVTQARADATGVHSRRALLGAGLAGGAAAVLAACDSDDTDPTPNARRVLARCVHV